MPPLLLFTTSQAPLPIRTPHPRKPILNIPPLVHRALHSALDADPPSHLIQECCDCNTPRPPTLIIPHPETLTTHDLPTNPPRSSAAKTIDHAAATDVAEPDEERETEVTVKLHLVGAGPRAEWVDEGLDVLARYKGLQAVDALLLGWKGVDYKGKKTAAAEMFGCGVEGLENGSGGETVAEALQGEVLATWKEVVQRRRSKEGASTTTRLGTLYMPLGLLKRLCEEGERAPVINALDTPDCHSLPKEYTGYAREQGVELWAGGGGEGSDPLPDADLHNLLQEFAPVLSSIVPPAKSEDHPLRQLIPLRPDGLKYNEDAARGVQVRWVLGYTLVSKTRNVVTDKGYIVSAELAG